MQAVETLIEIAHEQNGYTIGDPWRFSEFSLVAAIPIARNVEVPRGYRLLSEIGDAMKIKDTGAIDRMNFENASEFPVLIKAGEIVAGATQERALTISQVLMAGEQATLECVCVHATKGIREGQRVKAGGFAPHPVREVLYKNLTTRKGWRGSLSGRGVSQSEVWGSVNEHSRNMAKSLGGYRNAMIGSGSHELVAYAAGVNDSWTSAQDDLFGRLKESEKKFEAVIHKVPRMENQVGMALISLDGLDTLDVFGHPDSWEAIRKEILKAEASNIGESREGNDLFELRHDRARGVIVKALSESKFEEGVGVERKHTKTSTLVAERFAGEVVFLYDLPIHISLLKRSRN